MKTSAIVALSLLSLASAQPHYRRQQHHHHKRDYVYSTVVEEVTETVAVTKTVYVDGDAAPTSQAGQFYEGAKTSSKPYQAPSAPAYSPSTPAYQAPSVPAYQPSSSSTQQAAPVASSPSIYVPSSQPAYVPPPVTSTPAPSPPAYSAPAVESPSSPPQQQPTQAYTPPASTPSSSPSSGSGGVTGSFTKDSPCTGEISYYDVSGTGSCGLHSQNSDPVIALPLYMMDVAGKAKYCGAKVSITANGVTKIATVVDSCPGCSQQSGRIDVAQDFFTSFGPQEAGTYKAEWYFV